MIGDPLKAPGGRAGQQQEENPNHGIAACNSSRYRFVCSNLLLYGNLSPFLYQETLLLIFCSEDQRVPLLSLVISPAQDFCFNVLWNFHKTLVICSQISSLELLIEGLRETQTIWGWKMSDLIGIKIYSVIVAWLACV